MRVCERERVYMYIVDLLLHLPSITYPTNSPIHPQNYTQSTPLPLTRSLHDPLLEIGRAHV